jgi:YaiO family outer membrane protein
MLQVVLLMSLLGAAPAAAAPAGQIPTLVDATALAQEGHYEAALDAFRRIAAANPRDHQARLGIARVHVLMGNHDQAEPVYRSVLLEDPTSVEAMRGTGAALVALGRSDDGIDLLRRAENAQPQNPDVLEALVRAHARAGNSNLAVLYAERVVTLAPTETHRLALEEARVAHAHRVEITSFGERYNTAAPDTGSVDLRVNFRVREDLRVIGRGQHQRKFGFSEQRGGAGLEWRWRPDTTLFGQVLAGPNDNAVLPRVDVNGEIMHAAGSTEWVAGYRYFDFPSARLSVVSPGVTWWPSVRTSLSARYFLSVTDFPTLTGLQQDHSVALRGARRVMPRVWVNGGYAYGTENFETLSPDRVGDFRAHTASAGVRLDMRSLTSVVGIFEQQWRPNSVRMGRLSLSLMQRF